jgi:hypothetical protein
MAEMIFQLGGQSNVDDAAFRIKHVDGELLHVS